MLIISVVSWNNTGQKDVWRSFSHDQSRSSFMIKSGYSAPCQSSSVSLQGKRFPSLSGPLFLHVTTFTGLCFPFLRFSLNFMYCNSDNSEMKPVIVLLICFAHQTFIINYLAWFSGSTSPAENENALELSFTSRKEKTWQQTTWNEVLSNIWPSSSPVLLQDKVCAGWDISWLIFPLCGRGMEWVNYFYIIFFPFHNESQVEQMQKQNSL